MVVESRNIPVGTDFAILTLSKAAWKLGSLLSRLDQDTKVFDTTVHDLVVDIKALGNECDLLYAELEDGKADKRESVIHAESGIWKCLGEQVDESSLLRQELESLIRDIRVEDPAERKGNLDRSRTQIVHTRTEVRRHTDNLRATSLLITW